MKLQCDVTVKYCTGVIELQYPDKIDEYKYYYNTYRCQGLPAGPICNPGIESINAALQPDNTDYLYFVINTEPPYDSAFSASYDEHIENCTRMGYTAK
ncbi:Aminodeoxychorismate lyase [human gut metagenome]|uniref:Aminodeoxychorismate lyase n=1 Tax=human gut metagenome TaxID=408170 RepID=K1S3H1_9ZZZZ